MKTKKLLFELIEMKAILYNILYTLLCLFVLVLMFVSFASLTGVCINKGLINIKVGMYLYYPAMAIIYFVGYKLLSKNNYA